MFPNLWRHQEKAKSLLREGARSNKNQLLMMPTGSGKLIQGLDLIHGCLEKNKRALFLCDRDALIKQTQEKAYQFGLDFGVIQADNPLANWRAPFQIASVQTLLKRGFPSNPFDLIVHDECHIMYRKINESLLSTSAHIVGLSATPFTVGLGKLYSNLITPTTMAELTENGVLVPLKILKCTPINMKGAKTAGGEWTDKEREDRSLKIIGNVIAEWHKHAFGKKTIVFVSTIKECEHYTKEFNLSGVIAAAYTSRTKDDDEIITEFRKQDSKIKVLVSVGRLTRGFDCPDIECGVDVRPLRKSLSEIIQKIGRVVRSSPGKEAGLWLCHSGNIDRFLPEIEEIYYKGLSKLSDAEALDAKVRQEQEKEKQDFECPECGEPYFKVCMACGYERKPKPPQQNKVDGQMIEVKFGGKLAADSKYDLWCQLCGYVKEKSNKPGRAYFLYKCIMKEPPPRYFTHFDHTPPKQATEATLGKITSVNIMVSKGYYNANTR